MNFGNIENLLITAIIIIISVTVHEAAHAYCANALGDPTPKLQKRLNFNPASHIDPIGFIMLFLIGFGWGRPVIFNPNYFKHPIRDEALVAFAGPASNIALATVGILLQIIFSLFGPQFGFSSPSIAVFWQLFALTNIGLALFNMLPIPPLDGYRLILIFFPSSQKFFTNPQVQMFGILGVLVFMNIIGGHIIGTLATSIYRFIFLIVGGLFNI